MVNLKIILIMRFIFRDNQYLSKLDHGNKCDISLDILNGNKALKDKLKLPNNFNNLNLNHIN